MQVKIKRNQLFNIYVLSCINTSILSDTNKADVAKTVRWSDNTDDYIDDGGFDNNTDIDVQKGIG